MAKEKKSSSKKNKVQSKDKKIKFPIVGIGASAGGLEAYEVFFKKMKKNSGMAFILVSHLDPTHVSILPELISKQTKMKVIQIEDGQKIEPDHVYVIPPNKNLSILNHGLFLMELSMPRGLNLPIDNFFRSLAQDQGSNAICIILSGAGTDGTLGLKEIKGNLGMVMVQDDKSAKYDGMPRSAIATGLADYILPVKDMPKKLMEYVQHTTIEDKPVLDNDSFQPALNKIFILLRSQTNHDFSQYKKNTICRRIERRMHIQQVEDVNDYVAYLARTEREVNALFKDLLIGVTSFFRDEDAFENLKKNHLMKALKAQPDDSRFRIWVPGCSTGEEAYSIAILIYECMEQIGKQFDVQIFGTDIDEDAINIARAGIYPLSIAGDLSQDRLKRFFTKDDNTYKIKKTIREMLVFAPQNVIKDPPFTKLDLLSCRNLLIYLGTNLQKKIFPIFHYSLKDDGVLFLGSSESIGQTTDLFKVEDKKWKIFKKHGKTNIAHPALEIPHHPQNDDEVIEKSVKTDERPAEIDNLRLVETILEQSDTPPCAIIDGKNNIVYIHGRTGKYLEPAAGKANFNILEMARPGLKAALAAIIRKAVNSKHEFVQKGVEVQENGGFSLVDVIVRPLQEWGAMRSFVMVAFKDATKKKYKKKTNEKVRKDKALEKVEQELQYTKENLQTTIEELETSNEELKSTNEELQSTNEELQSTNEELETSKEELQSLNEESATVNAELQSRIDELSKTTDDMKNLLDSTQIATVFLDIDLCVRRFTPMATELIPLSNTDIGRPISHFATQLKEVKIADYAQKVLDDLAIRENNVKTQNNRTFKIRVLPYRTIQNVIDGVVITFEDISNREIIEKELEERRVLLEAILQCTENGIMSCDSNGDLSYFNDVSKKFHGVPLEYIPSEQWSEYFNLFDSDGKTQIKKEDHPLEKLLSDQKVQKQKYVIKSQDAPARIISVTGQKLIDDNKNKLGAVVSITDITKPNATGEI